MLFSIFKNAQVVFRLCFYLFFLQLVSGFLINVSASQLDKFSTITEFIG